MKQEKHNGVLLQQYRDLYLEFHRAIQNDEVLSKVKEIYNKMKEVYSRLNAEEKSALANSQDIPPLHFSE